MERTTYYGLEETLTWTDFDVDGDYTTMETGEKNGFPKELKGGAVTCSEPEKQESSEICGCSL